MGKRRRRRLRKKLRLGEFREHGFEVRIRLLSGVDYDEFLDRLLLDAIERNDMAFGGGGAAPIVDGFVARWARGTLTEEDRVTFRSWLESRDEVEKFSVGPLVDSWHGEFEDAVSSGFGNGIVPSRGLRF